MTGVAALAICAAFTSCSKSDELYDPEVAKGISTEQAVANVYNSYNQAFIQTFGQPAANQDWGFGPSAKTRTYNVQGNLWHDPNYYNLEYDAKVTTAEKNMVFNYVNDVNNVETVDQITFTKYWVAQIWNGDKDQNAEGTKTPTSISYPNQNGATTEIVGAKHMDKLEIKEKDSDDSWIHCNNFNSADNQNYKEDGEGGRTLMWESGTFSFRNNNSQGSHISERYIIVPGANIDPSLSEFYYVCFDFEKAYTDAEKAAETTYFTYVGVDNNGAEQAVQTFSIRGYYTSTNMPTDQQIKDAVNNPNYKEIKNVSLKGYLYGDKHCDGDGNYTDWIVRISPARVVTSSDYDVRIMAEDLNAKADNGGTDDSDWDFNDVVLDLKFLGDDEVKICVVAAGGTLPLRINGEDALEVHGLYHQATDIMINTCRTEALQKKHPNHYNTSACPDFTRAISGVKAVKGKNIRLEVYKKLSNGEEKWVEMTATTGQPAAKFAVKPTVDYCNERQYISDKYNHFGEWVTTNGNLVWYNPD